MQLESSLNLIPLELEVGLLYMPPATLRVYEHVWTQKPTKNTFFNNICKQFIVKEKFMSKLFVSLFNI